MRPAVVIALAALMLLVGCSSPLNGPTTPGPEASTGTSPQTPTVPDTPPNATSENTVDFDSLTDRQREAFLNALDGEVSFAPSSPCIDDRADHHTDNYSELVHPFISHEYVTHDGQYYRITVATGPTTYLSKSYQLRRTTRGPDDSVVEFENLSAENQTYVQQAIRPDEYETPYQCASPDVFDRFRSGEFLSYNDETYAAEITLTEDAPKYLLTVTEYGINGSSGS